jgi:hypothetical protein
VRPRGPTVQRKRQPKLVAELAGQALVAVTAAAACVVGVELAAAERERRVMVKLDGAVATVGFGAPRIAGENAGAEFAVATSAASFGHAYMLPYWTTCKGGLGVN